MRVHPTGIPELDEILGGGLPSNRAYMLVGEQHTGKRFLALSVQKSALMRDEYCVYVTYGQSYSAVLDRYAAVGLDAPAYLERGLLRITDYYSLDFSARADVNRQLSTAEERGVLFMHPEDLEDEEKRKAYMDLHQRAIRGARQAGVVIIDSLNERLRRTPHDLVLRQFQEFKDTLSIRQGLLSLHLYTPLLGQHEPGVIEMFKYYEENAIELRMDAAGQRMVRLQLKMPPFVDDSWHPFAIKADRMIVQRARSTMGVDVLEKAVALAGHCQGEAGKVCPKVGAVIVKDGEEVCGAYRAEIRDGDHAEYTALERKCKGMNLRGAVLITTLEPCTKRGPRKTPCVEHIIKRGISKVVIGMLDPDEGVNAEGYFRLREAKIDIEFFPSELMNRIWEMNQKFVQDRRQRRKTALPEA